MKESLAVIIPVFNAEKFITRCIDSCIAQKELDEIIIIDDGSTDESMALIKPFLAKDSRLKLIQHVDLKNHGRSASRNLGILSSKSTWITFLDADDYFLRGRFDDIATKMKAGGDGYYEAVRSEYESKNLRKLAPLITSVKNDIQPQMLQNYLIEHREDRVSLISLIVKRELCISIGLFDKILDIGEDTDFIWRIAAVAHLMKINNSSPRIIRQVHAQNSYYQSSELTSEKLKFYKKWASLKNNYALSKKANERIMDSVNFYQHKLDSSNSNILRWLCKKTDYLFSKCLANK